MKKGEVVQQLKKEGVKQLFREADRVRKAYCGDEVHIRGIIAFSNYCCRNCLYCGLRKENNNLLRYRIIPDEIVRLAQGAIESGVKTIVLQSGDDFWYNQKMLSGIISKIKNRNKGVAITLSVGERPYDDYKAFRDAGCDRYLLKHETANPVLYKRLHPGYTFKKRIEILEYLKGLGYQIGSGNIVGLPGQTLEDLAEDILLLKNLEIDMAGIGPFLPQKDTPLKSHPAGDFKLTLKVLALVRIVAKDTHLPATTALATLDAKRGQRFALKAGANVIMPDFTPKDYRKDYIIYDNKEETNLERAKEVIFEAGRKVSLLQGDSLKHKECSVQSFERTL